VFFPLARLSERRLTLTALALSVPAMAFLAFQCASWAFIA
jgi:hypothetical protein